MSEAAVLYDWPRSSAAYRVRIALHLKQIAFRTVPIDLRIGAQSDPAFTALNPQGLVPALAIDGQLLTQSLAIIEYLDVTRPEPPLLPADPAERAATWARALTIAADIHPVQNLRVMNRLKSQFGADDDATAEWNRHWIAAGFAALEQQAPETGLLGGAAADLSDLCLVPQMANARRFELSLEPFPRLVRIDAELRALPAFAAAAPEAVKI